ncbi:MAG: copper resistance CopC family protein [Propionibacteriaceae bacterium]
MSATRRVVRLAAGCAALTLGLVLMVALPASAHDVLISTAPADHATVDRTPGTVVLTFNEPAVAMGTQLVVTGPSGEIETGAPRLVDATVSQDLQGGAPAGTYTVSWRVTSADGHPVTGTFTFTSKAAGAGRPSANTTATPTAAPVPDPMAASRGYVVAALAAVLVLAGLIIQAVRRRRTGTRR